MEIICAGYPKTGSKSCSSALRELGYMVADYAETGAYLSYEWTDFVNGKIGIDEVTGKGIQMNKMRAKRDINFFENDKF